MACGGPPLVRRYGLLLFKRETLTLLDQPLAVIFPVFVFIAVLDGTKVLLRSEDESTGEYETTEQQQCETRERADVSRAANLCVELMLRKSVHRLLAFCMLSASHCARAGSRQSHRRLGPLAVSSALQQPSAHRTNKP